MLNIRGALLVLAVLSFGAVAQEGITPEGASPDAAPAEATPDKAAPPAAAASQKPDEDFVEKIVVTGSRIPRVEFTTAAPVTLVNRTQIDSSGRPFIGDVLQSIPEQSNAINTQFNGGGDGSTRINLRGLGVGRTLVLLNGRRFVAGGTGADPAVDLNSIPTAAIQRIEILKDGASAVYGSDAISGVVNIITRKDFSGTEAYAYGGTSTHGDGTMVDVGGTTGLAIERGNILFSAGFARQQPVWAGDRTFSKYDEYYDYYSGQVSTLGSSSIPQGRVFTAGIPAGSGNAAWLALRAQYPSASSFVLDKTTNLWRPYNGAGVEDAGGDQYNYQPENYLVTPRQRGHLFAVGEYKLFPGVRGYFEGSFTNRISEQKLAPEPLFVGAGGEPVRISAQNPYNPFGVDIPNFRRRLVEFGNRASRQDVNTFRLVTGVTGSLPIPGLPRWNWDVSLNLGRNDATSLKQGSLQLSLLQNAIGPGYRDPATGQYYCGAPGSEIAGCVPLNLFGGAAAKSITPDMARYLSYDGTTLGANQQFIIAANLSGELFRVMPNAHLAGLALGYEYRKEDGKYIPDPLTAKGDTTGNKGEATAGSFSVNEGYLELSVPVLGQMGETAPGKDLLELNLAARVAAYTTFGTNLSYKAGFRLSPIQDVTLRGTYSTAFRAPSIGELYSGQYDNFPAVSDPCSSAGAGTRPQGTPLDAACDADGVPDDLYDDRSMLLTRRGGNPNLGPETANIFTLGLVAEPRFLKDVSLTIGYYDIDVQSSVGLIGSALILQGCYPTTAGSPPQYCDKIDRDPTGFITTIHDQLTNVGGDHTSGVDIGLRYEPQTPVGRVLLSVDAAWINIFDTLLAGNKLVHGKGNYDLGVHPDWTGNAGVTWAKDPFRASLRARFVGPFIECSDANGGGDGGSCWVDPKNPNAIQNPSRTVQPYSALDANVSWTLDSGLGASTLSAGVNNLLDAEPARIWNGFTANSDASAYDYLGRYFYARVTHKFP